MEINLSNAYIGTDYSNYAEKIISFPEFLKENNLEISIDDFKDYLRSYKLRTEIQNLFSKYIQKIHTDLDWRYDVIEEHKKDIYFHLLAIANVGLKLNYKDPNFNLSNAENLTLLITNKFQFTTDSKYEVETSNERNELIENYGYKVFLDFKTYLFEKSRNNLRPKIKTELSNPEKIAVLYATGIETTLNKFPIIEDRYRFIHALIGGDYSNIKKVMIAGVSSGNKTAAQEFINSKTI
ncbi:hypothetical protein QGN23_13275 [Chryseobacterium gotjawalense]|uniref:Uncharacterized protein n=1 Tax=Chryseobacterium gotjawalense TaxID=3042315 RepID=A0ABY8RBN7_9FLAO|nr:hypothetical protein [Chryseobacterium sp. wdc7]WHF51380.1 hypothetical protein QGN23_13275 [Chryseobacterium sp. wdc7]